MKCKELTTFFPRETFSGVVEGKEGPEKEGGGGSKARRKGTGFKGRKTGEPHLNARCSTA